MSESNYWPEEYDDEVWDSADDDLDDDVDVREILWEHGQCFNCGCRATEDPDHPGEYHCPNCGDVWDVNEPAPQIP